jgi:hypothetical protein
MNAIKKNLQANLVKIMSFLCEKYLFSLFQNVHNYSYVPAQLFLDLTTAEASTNLALIKYTSPDTTLIKIRAPPVEMLKKTKISKMFAISATPPVTFFSI